MAKEYGYLYQSVAFLCKKAAAPVFNFFQSTGKFYHDLYRFSSGMEIKMRKVRVQAALLILGCFCCILIGFLCGCDHRREEKKEESVLPSIIVGSDVYPPYNYYDENGNPTGIDVDIATEAFHRIGYQAVFITIPWEEKKELLESGEIDCVWGCFSIAGREEEYCWTSPYMVSRQIVAVPENSEIYHLRDLEDKVVAVQATTKPEEIFLSHEDFRIPQLRMLISLEDRELIYTMMGKGYADAVAAHETAVLQYMKDYGMRYRILEEPLMTTGIGVAFALEDTRGLETKLSEVFDQMMKDGSMKRIVEKYLDNADSFLEVNNLAS